MGAMPTMSSWDPRRLPRVRMFPREPRVLLWWALALGTFWVVLG